MRTATPPRSCWGYQEQLDVAYWGDLCYRGRGALHLRAGIMRERSMAQLTVAPFTSATMHGTPKQGADAYDLNVKEKTAEVNWRYVPDRPYIEQRREKRYKMSQRWPTSRMTAAPRRNTEIAVRASRKTAAQHRRTGIYQSDTSRSGLARDNNDATDRSASDRYREAAPRERSNWERWKGGNADSCAKDWVSRRRIADSRATPCRRVSIGPRQRCWKREARRSDGG